MSEAELTRELRLQAAEPARGDAAPGLPWLLSPLHRSSSLSPSRAVMICSHLEKPDLVSNTLVFWGQREDRM